MSPSPGAGSPARPQEHTPSPTLPLHFCFIYEYVARIPMSYLFCGPVIFPPRPCRRLTQGPVATVRRKEDSERILFNFFLCFTHFSLCLPPGLLPSSAAPSLPQPPLLSPYPLYVTRIAQMEAQEGPIGNAQDPWEKKAPNKLYTRCITLYGQTGKHKSEKTKGVN